MNLSRVIGPPIGAVAYHFVGPSWVFAGNAVTYLFVVIALMMVTLPAMERVASGELAGRRSNFRELLAGVTVARQDKVVGRCLVTVFVFSLLALAFLGQMPVVAAHNLGIDPNSANFHGILCTLAASGRAPSSGLSPSAPCSPTRPSRPSCASACWPTPSR